MKPQEIIKHCEKQIALGSKDAGFMMPGKWGKRDTKRLWPKGPIGEIVQEFPHGVYVMFDAEEVLKAVNDQLAKFGGAE